MFAAHAHVSIQSTLFAQDMSHIMAVPSLKVVNHSSILLAHIRRTRGGDSCRPITLILLVVSALSRSPIDVFPFFLVHVVRK